MKGSANPVLWLAAAAVSTSLWVAAQPPAPSGAVAPPAAGGEPGFYLGFGNCMVSGCHASIRAQTGGRVLGNEYYTWLRNDPHQGAYDTLFEERSRAIAGHLRLGEPYRAAVCLDCHSVHVPKARLRGPLALEDGVSCEGCHGPASGWRDGHTDPSWTHADSVARGLVDLRNPVVRAEVCLRCHLGDATRSVDHSLIAAGHPPLTFELDNYSQEMSPHWRPAATPGVAAWAVGQAAAFREGLEQLAGRAAGESWPEFADLSCSSCHHAYEPDRWQRAGAFRDRERPGLPPWSPARWAVLRQVVEEAAPAERPGLDGEVRQLAAAVARLNQPRQVAASAERAAAAMARVVPAVAAATWDPARVRALVAALAADRDGWVAADVRSAEQAFFAVQTLAGFLVEGDPRLAGGELPARLDRLYRELSDPQAFDRERFATLLAEVAQAVGGR